MEPLTTIAVDWSGRADDRGGTWVARAEGGRLVELAPRTRSGAVRYVIEAARRDRRLVAGFDFAFSFPAWFVERHGAPPAVWEAVAREGEAWLRDPPHPFWGRAGSRRPDDCELFRRSERDLVGRGLRVKSVFQIAGAGSVGTGSIRGMPHLLRLEDAGFGIWPFAGFTSDAASGRAWPRALEIYPRSLTGPVVKSKPAARGAALAALRHRMRAHDLEAAAGDENAFDAALAALGMADHAEALTGLEPGADGLSLAEGAVWVPGTGPLG